MAFHFTPQLARFLCSARGAEWLRQVERLSLTPAGRLSDLQTLRRHLSADEAAAVLEQGLLRRRAGEKFGRAAGMLFTRPALEQATHRQVARYRAKRFAGLARVADLGCGIGGDSLRLARVAGQVWGFERDPVRLLFARHNAAVYGLSRRVRFAQADVLALPVPLPRFNALFADPARRTTAGARVFSPRRYRPPLDALLAAFAHRPMGIKVAPGLDYAPLAAVGEVEVISLRGEAKEAALWFNALATPGVTRRATLLPGEQTLTGNAPGDCPVGPLSDFLFEPDPAVIRTGLVKHLAARLNLHLIDEHIAYLSGPEPVASPFVAGYAVQARLPLKIHAINRYLNAHRIGRVNVKQRGTGLDPERVWRQLKPAPTGAERTLILVRINDDHLALIGQRLASPP